SRGASWEPQWNNEVRCMSRISRISCTLPWKIVLTWLLLLHQPLMAQPAPEPALLPPPRHGNVYVVCHRGAHEDRPENTLAAYQRAIDLKADYVEIDLRTTKDGHIVSVHNETIDAY